MNSIDWKELVKHAADATRTSTSTDHVVGAALLASDGMIYTGTNYPVNNHRSTIHSEDTAVSAMLSSGRGKTIIALVTIAFDIRSDGSASNLYFTYPCGSCRNLVYQYTNYGASDEAQVLWGREEVKSISEIYPISSDSECVPTDWF